jgi:heat shock protein HtpX
LYLIARLVGTYTGIGHDLFFIGFALFFLTLLNLGGPALLERRLRIRWLNSSEEERLAVITDDLANRAALPIPRLGESSLAGANAFALGRTKRDGRICLTRGLLDIVNEDELRAIVAHEISHIKNWDVTVLALLSVVPVMSEALLAIPKAISRQTGWLPSRLLFIAISSLVSPLVWVAWLALIPVNWSAMLLMNCGSRVRELNADRDAVELGIAPHHLASALFKIAGSPPNPAERPLIPAGPLMIASRSPGWAETLFFRQLDADGSRDISSQELASLRGRSPRLTWDQRVVELFSSHPLIEKRFHKLAEML